MASDSINASTERALTHGLRWPRVGSFPRRRQAIALLMGLVMAATAAFILYEEALTSRLQARYLSRLASQLTWSVEQGPSDRIVFPAKGPYDERLGYTRIPQMTERLRSLGFRVTGQARVSSRFKDLTGLGLFPIYREKMAGGLCVLDDGRDTLFAACYPRRLYRTLDEVPPVTVRTLLYIENRDLLDPRLPHRNPAVEWPRLFRAGMDCGKRILGIGGSVQGASTLATQLQKLRHSPGGITADPSEKLRQVASASIEAYLDGEETLKSQERIALEYLNAAPLSATAGEGEVTGLAEGLWAWYGLDYRTADPLLRLEGGPLRPLRPKTGTEAPRDASGEGGAGDVHATPASAGRAYRAVLSLLLANRRPTWYLARTQGRAELRKLTDAYLRVLGRDGVISPSLQKAALAAKLEVRDRAPNFLPTSFVDRKAANSIRFELLNLLEAGRLYDLDRYDLTVQATINREVQKAVSERIASLADRDFVRRNGLDAWRLLGRGKPEDVIYSFILYERTPFGNAVRVQTDNYDQPVDLNTAGRLELGSTAKLRTLITYLQIIEESYRRFAGRDPDEMEALLPGRTDPLTRWTAAWLRRHPEATLDRTLQAALDRRYSGNPWERFYTGGGLHTFANFDTTYDRRLVSVREAFRQSVNLPFIRLMRDIEDYYLCRGPRARIRILEDPSDPRRRQYLARFADEEGRVFVERFQRRLAGAEGDRLLDRVAEDVTPALMPLAWAFRSVLPEAPPEEFAAFLGRNPPASPPRTEAIADAYRRADPSGLSLADLGYLAGLHPLEIWTARRLAQHPEASLPELLGASTAARQEVYEWLFRARNREAQDLRIRTLLEAEVFSNILREWRRLGYPFQDLTPSLATAIGSSGDRPSALAELAGILVNDGVRYPVVKVDRLRFAAGTPFETTFEREPVPGERVLSSGVARAARGALRDVVEAGTARRARGAITGPDGAPVPIGGKTGTGDNRYVSTDSRGNVISSRPVNRTSVFVFYFGDRFYGVMTAFVPGPESDRYRFTSALPVQVVRLLGPELSRLQAAADPVAGFSP